MLETLNDAINDTIIEDSRNNSKELPIDFILGTAKVKLAKSEPPEQTCKTAKDPTITEDESPEKDKFFQLVFLANASPGEDKIEVTPEYISEVDLQTMNSINKQLVKDARLSNLIELSPIDISELSKKINLEFNSSSQPVERDREMHIFANLLLRGGSEFYNSSEHNNFNDGGHRSITNWIGTNIKSQNFQEDDVLKVISHIKSNLYLNYNSSRNFSDDADSDNRYIGRQINGYLNYANTVEKNFDGGVCDDIAAIGCDIYNTVYPDKDCLVMNISSLNVQHEVMIVGDRVDNYKVIEGGVIYSGKDRRFLSSNVRAPKGAGREQAMFIRLQKVEKGNLKDVYILKTEYGTFIDKLINGNEKIASNINCKSCDLI